MRAERIDWVMFYDLDFIADELTEAQLTALTRASSTPGRMHKLYEESFDWLFYQDGEAARLRAMRRIDVTHLATPSANAMGASLLVSPEYGVAALSLWRSTGPTNDVTETINGLNYENAGIFEALAAIGLGVREAQREYPFIAITIAEDDIAAYVSANAAALGRLLPGGFEHEEEQYLRRPILEGNLSRREYERLYITWTDALAVYCHRGVDKPDTLELTFFRALQLYETCVIVWRLLQTTQIRMDETYSSLRAWRPRPWRVNALMESVARIRRDLVNAAPVQSIESARLLHDAYAEFGLNKEAERAAERVTLLETRFQWSKAQFLAGVAILAFTLEKLQILSMLAHWLHIAPPGQG